MADRKPDISVVIPTYNEIDTIGKVVGEIEAVARAHDYAVEIIIVDDNSPDGTGQEAERLARHFPVRAVHRPQKLGLGTAAVEGFRHARGRIWGLMDGDGSHPARDIPRLVEPIRSGRCEIAIASRYMPGGGVEYWPRYRWVLSRAATLLARIFTPQIRDPLSGFLFFDRSVIEGIPLTVTGYKIGLEILIKGRYARALEVPYTFRNRETGASNLGWPEYLNYLDSLVRHALYSIRHRKERRWRRDVASRSRRGASDPIAERGERLWGPCPLCGADNSRRLFEKQGYRYARCRWCGFVFVNPMPPPDELAAIYRDPRYFANRNEWSYGYDDYAGERTFHRGRFDRRMREIETALGVDSGAGLRLLDLGCAAGYLLEAARERNWEAVGVELSQEAAETARQASSATVQAGDFRDTQLEDDSFDCVAAFDFLEHVADPIGALREAMRVLRPGGVLAISTPDVRSLSARLFGRRWFHFKRDHVVLFSRHTLQRALDQVGFDVVSLARHDKMVSLNYLFARLKVYVPFLGKALLATLGRAGPAKRPFHFPFIGETLALCRKRNPAEPPPVEEAYGRMRAHYWRPTAFWRTAEYFRLHGLDAEPPILDVGSGDGFFARQVFPVEQRSPLVGIDLRHNELSDLVRIDATGRAAVADARALPFRDESFRFVLANCALEHVEGVDAAIAEIARVLAPGGGFAFTVPAEGFNDRLFFATLFRGIGLTPLARLYGRVMDRALNHVSVLPDAKWRELLLSCGLKIERMEFFMPPRLARMWDRRWWWGLPRYVLARFLGRTRYRRLRPCRVPGGAAVCEAIRQPAETGAGAVYFCLKPMRPEEVPPEALDPEWSPE